MTIAVAVAIEEASKYFLKKQLKPRFLDRGFFICKQDTSYLRD